MSYIKRWITVLLVAIWMTYAVTLAFLCEIIGFIIGVICWPIVIPFIRGVSKGAFRIAERLETFQSDISELWKRINLENNR